MLPSSRGWSVLGLFDCSTVRGPLSMSSVHVFCPYWVLHCCTAVQFVPISNLSIAVGIMQASRLHAGCTQALHTSNMLLQNVNDPVWCAQEGCDQHQPCGKEFLTLYNVYAYIGVYILLGCTVHTWMAFLHSSKLNMYWKHWVSIRTHVNLCLLVVADLAKEKFCIKCLKHFHFKSSLTARDKK